MRSTLGLIALILTIIGGLNWGLIAINSGWDLVSMISGGYNVVSRIIYGLVGLSALVLAYQSFTQ